MSFQNNSLKTHSTHFSLACASDGTVDPLPFAYILFVLGLIFITTNAQYLNLVVSHQHTLTKVFVIIFSLSISSRAISLTQFYFLSLSLIFIYENVYDLR